MRILLILLALAAIPCTAGQVYKCKGPKGEVTFTNIKCPDNAATQKYGTFESVPDNPRQYREAIADHNSREEAAQQQQSMTAQPAANVASNGGGSSTVPGGYQCSVNGKSWISATPCPSTSTHYTTAPVHGNIVGTGEYVTGTATVRESVPVQQQTISRGQLCDQASSGSAVAERGKSLGDSGYERRKVLGNGCR